MPRGAGLVIGKDHRRSADHKKRGVPNARASVYRMRETPDRKITDLGQYTWLETLGRQPINLHYFRSVF
jgi:hypothetical protein